MKKKIAIIAAVLSCIMSVMLYACDELEQDTPPPSEPGTYSVQYTDNTGVHTIEVETGKLYALESLPEKNGYEFLGLFDAATGGTQYVNAGGSAMAAFTDNKNIVLYPQFKAKEYTLALDFQGAQVVGDRQFTVAYGSSLPPLPKDLQYGHNAFKGWYTKPNCEGVRISDEYGLVPIISIVNENNFDLTKDGIILYAGFEVEKFTVTCYFEAGMDAEEIQVEYGTFVSSIVPVTRVEGKAPYVWSKSKGGEPFVGKITSDTVLYALEYAPVIELNSNGGSEVNAFVAPAGAILNLPRPTKELAEFVCWIDSVGSPFTESVMPDHSISLYAYYVPKIVFDSNGGSKVTDVFNIYGEAIELPTPEREGYLFAGWYTAEKKPYKADTMPMSGLKLKAGWYKSQTATVTLCSGNSYLYDGSNGSNTSVHMRSDLNINLSTFLPADFDGMVQIKAYFKARREDASQSYQKSFTLYFYSQNKISDDTLLFNKRYILSSEIYTSFDYELTAHFNGNKLYGAISVSDTSKWTYISDYYLKVTYPDLETLYL